MAALQRALAIGLGLSLCLVAADPAWAQTKPHPFGAPSATGAAAPLAGTRPDAPPSVASISPWGAFQRRVQNVQRELHTRLGGAVRRIKTDGMAAAWLLAGLSFLYGVVHAAGPGHGKAVISSYLVAEERTLRRGVLLSFLASAAQALCAILIVGLLAVVLGAAGTRIKETATWLEQASYAMVAALGLWMTVTQLRRLWLGGPGRASCGHQHGEHADCDHSPGHVLTAKDANRATSFRKAAAVVLAVGLRPCTGAIIVLVFALAQGLFWAGVGATFAMALGTAITVSALAALAVGSKQLALRVARGNDLLGARLYNATALGGSIALMVVGSTLFVASLGPARPF